MVRVRLARLKGGALGTKSLLSPGRALGEVEEYFIKQLMSATASCSQVRF